MKNVIIGIVCLIVTIGVVFGVLMYTGIISFNTVEENHVLVNKDENGKTYTQREFIWRPKEYKKQILLVPDTSKVAKQVVSVNLYDNVYYDIKVPAETDYICDYGKTIYATDGSWQIRVMGGATAANLGSLTGIADGDSLSSNIIQTKYEDKGAKSIATLFDGYAVVCTIYEGDVAYTVMKNSIIENQNPYTVAAPTYTTDLNRLSKLSYSGSYCSQTSWSGNDITAHQIYFAEGEMYIATEFNNISKVKDDYLVQLCKISGADISEIYDAKGILYARAGDYHVGLLSYNENTTVVLFGNGEEAECNILSYLISLM